MRNKLFAMAICTVLLSSCTPLTYTDTTPAYLKQYFQYGLTCSSLLREQVDVQVSIDFCEPYIDKVRYEKLRQVAEDFSSTMCKANTSFDREVLAKRKIALVDEYQRHINAKSRNIREVCMNATRAATWRDGYEQKLKDDARLQQEMQNF